MRGATSGKAGLARKLGEPAYYQRVIERLHKKLAAASSSQLYETQPEGYSFAQAFFERRTLARLLARSVGKGAYAFSPARLTDIVVDKKTRTVCAFSMTDRIVQGAVYDMLAEDIQQQMPAHIYSYIKGRDKQQALASLADYVKAHRRRHADPRARGLFVLRCDIKAYGISIPVAPGSSLWRQLEEAFRAAYGRSYHDRERELLAGLVNPLLAHPDGGEYQRLFGIPDGGSLSALLLNLYAIPLDRELVGIEGGFYARYGDDMLFAHPDRDTFDKAVRAMDDKLAALGLARNPAKTQRLFFNGAGRGAPDCRGTTHVEFLGLRLGFDGALSLKQEKTRAFLRDLSLRAQATAQAAKGLDTEARGRLVCRHLNAALDPQATRAHPYTALLMRMVNDRRYLRQLDYRIAQLVVRAACGDVSAKGFRRVPYRTIRNDWQLASLEYGRNR